MLDVRSYPDHHAYTGAELQRVFERARTLGADAVVTTQKDAVRLPAVPDAPPLRVMRIEAVVDEADAFRSLLLRVATSS